MACNDALADGRQLCHPRLGEGIEDEAAGRFDRPARRILPTTIARPSDPTTPPAPDDQDMPWLEPIPYALLDYRSTWYHADGVSSAKTAEHPMGGSPSPARPHRLRHRPRTPHRAPHSTREISGQPSSAQCPTTSVAPRACRIQGSEIDRASSSKLIASVSAGAGDSCQVRAT